MHILLASQYFFPEQFSNNSIAKALVKRGHRVSAVTCVPNYGKESFFEGYSNSAKRREVWDGVEIFRSWTFARGSTKLGLLINYLVYPLSAIRELLRNRLTNADVSFVSMPSPLLQALVGIFLKKFYRVPTVYWVQDLWPESAIITLGLKNRVVCKILHAVCGWIYRQADIVLVQSDGFIDYISRYGVDRSRIHVFPNTAPSLYKPQEQNVALPVQPDSPFRLMFAGNLGESQDFTTIVKAARLLRDESLQWIIVGSGRHEAMVKKLVEDSNLGSRFRFEGRHPEDAMPAYFASADAMIVSLKDSDIFELTVPYKIQCYLACGRPILGSINGEGARIIEASGAGWAAPASRPDALARIIRKMIRLTGDERARMGAAGRRYFETNFDEDLIYDRLNAWLESAASSRRTGQL